MVSVWWMRLCWFDFLLLLLNFILVYVVENIFKLLMISDMYWQHSTDISSPMTELWNLNHIGCRYQQGFLVLYISTANNRKILSEVRKVLCNMYMICASTKFTPLYINVLRVLECSNNNRKMINVKLEIVYLLFCHQSSQHDRSANKIFLGSLLTFTGFFRKNRIKLPCNINLEFFKNVQCYVFVIGGAL